MHQVAHGVLIPRAFPAKSSQQAFTCAAVPEPHTAAGPRVARLVVLRRVSRSECQKAELYPSRVRGLKICGAASPVPPASSFLPIYLQVSRSYLVTTGPSILMLPSSMLTMETSFFLTSKLSPKNMAMPSPAGVAKPKHLMLFNNKRASSSITCCSYNDAAPVIDRDWRSFRAQLYFNEQYSKSVDQAVAAVAAAAAMPEPVKIGDKWAHPLVEPEKGCLLIATEKLDGSHIFERTVILLLSAGVLGPVGVILNRPSLMSIKEAQTIFADTDIAGAFSGRPLFFGGPLEECFFLLGPRVSAGDVVGRTGLFEEVMPGLHYGTRESVGCAAELVKRGVVGVRDFRFFDGFCGWEREQLRDEVRAGLWHVAACSPAVLGLASVVKGGLWEEVQGLVGESRVW